MSRPSSRVDGVRATGPLAPFVEVYSAELATRGYLALGVTVDGDREVLGIWWQETEGAKFWLAVLNDLRRGPNAESAIPAGS